MKLHTEIDIEPLQNRIHYGQKLLLLGSCFSENIGAKLEYFKYDTMVNPFGVLFHPVAIMNLLSFAVNDKKFVSEDVFFLNQRWHCFDAHSKLSGATQQEAIDNLNKQVQVTRTFLKQTNYLVITLGTSWAYRHNHRNALVANCHKVPNKNFTKEILSVDIVESSLDNIYNLIKQFNPSIKIIYTVSPVRHQKDGFVENMRSKSHLITAIHNAISTDVFYFPSYELMMDEMRDYRFYSADMLHPNDIAVSYIWEKFEKFYLVDTEKTLRDKVLKLQKILSHRILDANSPQYEVLSNRIERLKNELIATNPFINF